jgi:hypothetical protein
MNNVGIPIIGLGERTPEYADLPLHSRVHQAIPGFMIRREVAPEPKPELDVGDVGVL